MPGVVGHLRTCSNRALDGRAHTRTAAERLIGCRNCLQGGCFVEVTNVAGMILVQEIVGLHISNVIETQNNTRFQFALHTKIHLKGAGRLKVGANMVARAPVPKPSWSKVPR